MVIYLVTTYTLHFVISMDGCMHLYSYKLHYNCSHLIFTTHLPIANLQQAHCNEQMQQVNTEYMICLLQICNKLTVMNKCNKEIYDLYMRLLCFACYIAVFRQYMHIYGLFSWLNFTVD